MAKKDTHSGKAVGEATKGTTMFNKIAQKHMNTNGPYTPTGNGSSKGQKKKG